MGRSLHDLTETEPSHPLSPGARCNPQVGVLGAGDKNQQSAYSVPVRTGMAPKGTKHRVVFDI